MWFGYGNFGFDVYFSQVAANHTRDFSHLTIDVTESHLQMYDFQTLNSRFSRPKAECIFEDFPNLDWYALFLATIDYLYKVHTNLYKSQSLLLATVSTGDKNKPRLSYMCNECVFFYLELIFIHQTILPSEIVKFQANCT